MTTAERRPSDPDAGRARFSRLLDRRTFAKGRSYRSRSRVDCFSPLIAEVTRAIRAAVQSRMVVVREAVAHPVLQYYHGGAVIGVEVPALVHRPIFARSNFTNSRHARAFLLRALANKELNYSGDQPADRVHWDVLSGQQRTRPVETINASRRPSDSGGLP